MYKIEIIATTIGGDVIKRTADAAKTNMTITDAKEAAESIRDFIYKKDAYSFIVGDSVFFLKNLACVDVRVMERTAEEERWHYVN